MSHSVFTFIVFSTWLTNKGGCRISEQPYYRIPKVDTTEQNYDLQPHYNRQNIQAILEKYTVLLLINTQLNDGVFNIFINIYTNLISCQWQ